MQRYEFKECAPCAAKLGSPELCAACIHNRNVIESLQPRSKYSKKQMRARAYNVGWQQGRQTGYWIAVGLFALSWAVVFIAHAFNHLPLSGYLIWQL